MNTLHLDEEGKTPIEEPPPAPASSAPEAQKPALPQEIISPDPESFLFLAPLAPRPASDRARRLLLQMDPSERRGLVGVSIFILVCIIGAALLFLQTPPPPDLSPEKTQTSPQPAAEGAWLGFLPLLAAVAGAFALHRLYRPIRARHKLFQEGTAAMGQILYKGREMVDSLNPNPLPWSILEWRFYVNGDRYTGSLRLKDPEEIPDLQRGQKVIVLYNPDHPGSSTIYLHEIGWTPIQEPLPEQPAQTLSPETSAPPEYEPLPFGDVIVPQEIVEPTKIPGWAFDFEQGPPSPPHEQAH